MKFYPAEASVPEELKTAAFTLRPLAPAHVKLDYAALMTSKEMLRLWSGSPWPQDDFTLVDNLQDLQGHFDEHQRRLAFTYTVLNTAESECLGCVYIKPLSEVGETGWKALGAPLDYHALVRFWVIQSRLADRLDARLLAALRRWFTAEWAFTRVLFHTRAANQQQATLFQNAGLRHVITRPYPGRGGDHLFFSEPQFGIK